MKLPDVGVKKSNSGDSNHAFVAQSYGLSAKDLLPFKNRLVISNLPIHSVVGERMPVEAMDVLLTTYPHIASIPSLCIPVWIPIFSFHNLNSLRASFCIGTRGASQCNNQISFHLYTLVVSYGYGKRPVDICTRSTYLVQMVVVWQTVCNQVLLKTQ